MLVKRKLTLKPRRRFVKIVPITLLGILSAAAAPAYAGPSQVGHQIDSHVKIKAQDLQTPEGIEKIYKRLRRQAQKACAGRSSDGKSKPKVENICQGHLMNDYIESVNDPNLTQYHQSMTG